MKLTSPSEVRELMAEFGISFNKSFGQNFLINESIPKRIAEECGADENDSILEIGPGIGTLTRELCSRYKKVVSVEIDKGLIPVLQRTTSDFDNITIINQDILKTDLSDLKNKYFSDGNVTVCANLPYYITSPIIMKLIEDDVFFENITVMVQKEVAQRLASMPGTAEYGALTATVRRYATVTKLFNVNSQSFMPAPKVDSAVVKISKYKNKNYSCKSEQIMTKVIRGAFAQRRKNLVNSLSTVFTEISKSDISDILIDCGYKTGVRGEELDTMDYALIADKIYDLKNSEV